MSVTISDSRSQNTVTISSGGVWFGEGLPDLPLRGFPAGRIEIVQRREEFARAIVYGEDVREFFVGIVHGNIEPVAEVGDA